MENISSTFSNDYTIPLNFVATVEPFKPRPNYNRNSQQPLPQLNPQTTQFCEKLGIDDPLEKLIGKPIILNTPVVNPDEIELEDEDEDEPVDDRPDEVVVAESNDIFFVDTKPQKRSKMNLPQPQTETFDDNLQCTEKVNNTAISNAESRSLLEKELVSAVVLDNVDEPGVKVTDNEDMPTSVKKFKRRNQELYMDQEGCI